MKIEKAPNGAQFKRNVVQYIITQAYGVGTLILPVLKLKRNAVACFLLSRKLENSQRKRLQLLQQFSNIEFKETHQGALKSGLILLIQFGVFFEITATLQSILDHADKDG